MNINIIWVNIDVQFLHSKFWGKLRCWGSCLSRGINVGINTKLLDINGNLTIDARSGTSARNPTSPSRSPSRSPTNRKRMRKRAIPTSPSQNPTATSRMATTRTKNPRPSARMTAKVLPTSTILQKATVTTRQRQMTIAIPMTLTATATTNRPIRTFLKTSTSSNLQPSGWPRPRRRAGRRKSKRRKARLRPQRHRRRPRRRRPIRR